MSFGQYNVEYGSSPPVATRPPTINDVTNPELSGWLFRVLGRPIDVETLSDQQWDDLALLYLSTNDNYEDVASIDEILRGVSNNNELLSQSVYEAAPPIVGAYPEPIYEPAAPAEIMYPSNPVYTGANAYQEVAPEAEYDDEDDDEDDPEYEEEEEEEDEDEPEQGVY